MDSIRKIQELNQRELENGVTPEGSWHIDYRDTAYIFIGGLPFELSEGDIITIFSQYGEPVHLNLVRDKESGKSKGFAFLKYEDQRSTDLAVDNLGGSTVMGRVLKVDHTRYKRKDDEDLEDNLLYLDTTAKDSEEGNGGERRKKRRRTNESENGEERAPLKEEIELATLIKEHDEEDPMKAYLVQEKQEEVNKALAALGLGKKKHRDKERKERKEKHRSHRSRRERDEDKDGKGKRSERRRLSRSRDAHNGKEARLAADDPNNERKHSQKLSTTTTQATSTGRRRYSSTSEDNGRHHPLVRHRSRDRHERPRPTSRDRNR